MVHIGFHWLQSLSGIPINAGNKINCFHLSVYNARSFNSLCWVNYAIQYGVTCKKVLYLLLNSIALGSLWLSPSLNTLFTFTLYKQ